MKIPGRHIIHFYDLSHHTLRLFIMQRRQSARYLNIISFENRRYYCKIIRENIYRRIYHVILRSVQI